MGNALRNFPHMQSTQRNALNKLKKIFKRHTEIININFWD